MAKARLMTVIQPVCNFRKKKKKTFTNNTLSKGIHTEIVMCKRRARSEDRK